MQCDPKTMGLGIRVTFTGDDEDESSLHIRNFKELHMETIYRVVLPFVFRKVELEEYMEGNSIGVVMSY